MMDTYMVHHQEYRLHQELQHLGPNIYSYQIVTYQRGRCINLVFNKYRNGTCRIVAGAIISNDRNHSRIGRITINK